MGPKLIKITTDKIRLIKEHLVVAQSRLKRYAAHYRRDLEFQVGDYMLSVLKVLAWKGH